MPGDSDPSAFDSLLSQIRAAGSRLPDSTLALHSPRDGDWDLFLAMCDAHRTASDAQKARLREEAGRSTGMANHLLGFVHAAAEKLASEKDPRWLERGLAAAVLQNDSLDPRDFLVALAELYVCAEEAGIDPQPSFLAAGGAVPPDFVRYAVVASRRARPAT